MSKRLVSENVWAWRINEEVTSTVASPLPVGKTTTRFMDLNSIMSKVSTGYGALACRG